MSEKSVTTEIEVNGTVVPVATLPVEIRNEVELFDRINEDVAEVTYKQTVYAIAATGLRNKIMTDIAKFLNPESTTEESSDDKATE